MLHRQLGEGDDKSQGSKQVMKLKSPERPLTEWVLAKESWTSQGYTKQKQFAMKYTSWISWHGIIGKCDAYLKHNEEVETKLGINVEQELRHGDPYKVCHF